MTDQEVPGQTSLPRQGPSFLPSREERRLRPPAKITGYTITLIIYPAKLAGVPDALIFFCFFSSLDGRKEGHQEKEKKV
ncbi:hypothetical protein C7123_06615 [Tannerella serpentiformis]|nr:hypothetical protein BCB71_11600 [Tannerella serpentiformis]AVV53424.1 hypothetical protein C7123_06615 [Tannerella serpentiformis]